MLSSKSAKGSFFFHTYGCPGHSGIPTLETSYNLLINDLPEICQPDTRGSCPKGSIITLNHKLGITPEHGDEKDQNQTNLILQRINKSVLCTSQEIIIMLYLAVLKSEFEYCA